MGADIHLYPEYSTFRNDSRDYWQSFATDMNPGRDYELFGVLAGVRGQETPLVPLRGLPDHPSITTSWDNTVWVSDTEGEKLCSKETAESWVRTGCSRWLDDSKRGVTHPDHHSHTWLTLPEFKAAIAILGRDVAHGYYGLIAALEEMERRGAKTRIVMWFDN